MSDKSSGGKSTWQTFVNELQQNILPIYLEHESTFDQYQIHGRMHICRAVIFGEVMARCYAEIGESIDFYAIRSAIAFHDSGRKGNGVDEWEDQSARNCYNYLVNRPVYQNDPIAARKIADRIVHENLFVSNSLEHDADVLEIMRPVCGHGGWNGFRKDVLRFAGHRDPLCRKFQSAGRLRDRLILEAWKFIEGTENEKASFSQAHGYMEALLTYLSQRRSTFELLLVVCE
jgi:hypothetical protein